MAPNESEDEHMEGDDGTEDSSLAYDPNQNREEKSKQSEASEEKNRPSSEDV